MKTYRRIRRSKAFSLVVTVVTALFITAVFTIIACAHRSLNARFEETKKAHEIYHRVNGAIP